MTNETKRDAEQAAEAEQRRRQHERAAEQEKRHRDPAQAGSPGATQSDYEKHERDVASSTAGEAGPEMESINEPPGSDITPGPDTPVQEAHDGEAEVEEDEEDETGRKTGRKVKKPRHR